MLLIVGLAGGALARQERSSLARRLVVGTAWLATVGAARGLAGTVKLGWRHPRTALAAAYLTLFIGMQGYAGFKAATGSSPKEPAAVCEVLRRSGQSVKQLKRGQGATGIAASEVLATLSAESRYISNAVPAFALWPRKWNVNYFPARSAGWSLNPLRFGLASSALGYAQAIDGTWAKFAATRRSGASRTNLVDAIDFVFWYHGTRGGGRAMKAPGGTRDTRYYGYHDGYGAASPSSDAIGNAKRLARHQREIKEQLKHCTSGLR